jgi:hypothetical protein
MPSDGADAGLGCAEAPSANVVAAITRTPAMPRPSRRARRLDRVLGDALPWVVAADGAWLLVDIFISFVPSRLPMNEWSVRSVKAPWPHGKDV